MENLKIRKPAVAGHFYPAAETELRAKIETLVDQEAAKQDVYACMLPHAGYPYSGRVAGETVSRINIPDTVILLGPNHTGLGSPFSIMAQGAWRTPLGDVEIDTALAEQILGRSEYLQDDTLAHLDEHSLEVELPFLQYFKDGFKIVPVAFMSDELKALKEVGREIAEATRESHPKGSLLIVASSDMTHYEPQETARRKDQEAIQAILGLDEDALMKRIKGSNISMCGYAPVIAMLAASKARGAKGAKLIKYQTSGDITGDKASVVGYAGIIIY